MFSLFPKRAVLSISLAPTHTQTHGTDIVSVLSERERERVVFLLHLQQAAADAAAASDNYHNVKLTKSEPFLLSLTFFERKEAIVCVRCRCRRWGYKYEFEIRFHNRSQSKNQIPFSSTSSTLLRLDSNGINNANLRHSVGVIIVAIESSMSKTAKERQQAARNKSHGCVCLVACSPTSRLLYLSQSSDLLQSWTWAFLA